MHGLVISERERNGKNKLSGGYIDLGIERVVMDEREIRREIVRMWVKGVDIIYYHHILMKM